jgi:site-specific recombinase XerD
MLDAMQLRGMSVRTQRAYIDAVIHLSRYYRGSPEALDGEQIQSYLLYLLRERKLSRSTVNQAGCAFRFLYRVVLERSETVQIPLVAAANRLPELLSREEVARVFACAPHPKARTLLMTAYGSGLRVSELCHLQVNDIDSAEDRMCLRVVQGKGAKDRYVPLSPDLLEVLRTYWRAARPRHWYFAAEHDGTRAIAVTTAQRWWGMARDAAGITKRGGIHTLRHCYATHLLEAGVDLHSIGQWLGHRHLSTTTRYLHLARPDLSAGARREPLALLSALPS